MQNKDLGANAQCAQFIEDLKLIDSTDTICPVCLDEENHN